MSNIVTAATVRSFFNADAKRVARLPEAARVSVQPGARGRLHAEVIKAYNKGRKADKKYVTGATNTAKAAQKDANRKARADLLSKGIPVGSRGPLPGTVKPKATKPKATKPKATKPKATEPKG